MCQQFREVSQEHAKLIEWLNLTNLRQNLNTLGGRLSRCLHPNSGTSGLWSILTLSYFPRM